MTVGRPPLPIGAWGDIGEPRRLPGTKARYIASARFRDTDGVTRKVTRQGDTKGRAKDALREALTKRRQRVQAALIDDKTTITQLADQWLASGDWAANTVERYTLAVKHVKAAMGRLRMPEFTRAAVNTALTSIATQHGPASAKSAKSVLNGMAKLALQFDALPHNPVRDAITIKQPRKEAVRVLTPAETEDLCDRLRTDEQASYYTAHETRGVRYDLADLVDFMLGTGCRIGEACAARYTAFDLEAGTWEINATVVRVKSEGLTIQPRPKTAAGWRILALPPYVVEMVRRRAVQDSLRSRFGVVFPSAQARTLRDPSNTAADLRLLLDRHGYPWVHSHLFRKTVATRLDEAGVTAKQVADQLGHANPSMTLDVYMGRKVVSADAARILER